MNIRKIAMIGSFAAGAALALAPFAAADPTTDITSTLDGEISSLNAIFQGDALFAGDYSDVMTNGANSFDTIPLVDAPNMAPLTTLDYELYGVNPLLAGPASDPGAYDVFNGALTEFDNSYNADLYGLLNQGALVPATDLFGGSEVGTALATGTDMGAATDFFNAGLADLAGYFDIPSF